MLFRRLEKPLLFLFIGLFASASFFLTYLFQQTHRENTAARERLAETEQRLREAGESLKEKETTLLRLQSDPEFIERTIRERLGWAREGEMLYHFEEKGRPPGR